MQVSLTLTGDASALAKILGTIGMTSGVEAENITAITEPEAPKKRGRPAKVAEKSIAQEVDEELAAETEDLGFEDEEPEDEEKEVTIDQIRAAFQAYARKHTRDKAAAVLAKYKVKSVNDLPKDKYAEILGKISV